MSAVLERSGYRSSVHHWKSAQPHVGPDPKGSFKIVLPAVERLKVFCSHQMLSTSVRAGWRAVRCLFQEEHFDVDVKDAMQSWLHKMTSYFIIY